MWGEAFGATNRQVFIEKDFELVMTGRFVFLPAFFMQAHPAAAALREVRRGSFCSTASMRAKV
jgi:hypothetical protein